MRAALERAIMHNNKINKHEVWRMLSSRQRVEKLEETLPSVAYAQVCDLAKDLACEFTTVERSVLQELSELPFDGAEQLEQTISTSPNEILLRLIIEGEDYAPIIWKIIEPKTGENVL